MKRNPRKKRWTKAFRKSAGKELAIDSTFEFEKKRNIPVRYDREKMHSVLNAMERVHQIKTKREKQFYANRMVSAVETNKKSLITEIKRHVNLDQTPNMEIASAIKNKRQKQQNKFNISSIKSPSSDTVIMEIN